MKKLALLICPILLLACCDDDDMVPQPSTPPPCVEVLCETEEELFGKAILNGVCWMADYTFLLPGKTIFLARSEGNGIEGGLSINLEQATDLQDTIWLWRHATTDPAPNLVSCNYSYSEGPSSVGEFDFHSTAEPTYEDFLIIDYFNADTSLIEGRFRVRFSDRRVNSFVNAPDTMRLGCGSFRVQKQ